MAHSLDANILIQAHRSTYPIDIAPGFWTAIENAGNIGQVFIIHDVYKELQDGDDDLSQWITDRRKSLVRDHRELRTQSEIPKIEAVVTRKRPAYHVAACRDFFSCADSWIVAHALAHSHIVVTEERPAPQSLRSVKMPDVCQLVGVRCIRTTDLLRQLGTRLILG